MSEKIRYRTKGGAWARLNIKAGRLVFGNYIGFANNVLGRGAVALCRALSPARTFDGNGRHQAAYKHLRRRGYVSVPSLYEPDVFARVVEKYNAVIDDDRIARPRGQFREAPFQFTRFVDHWDLPELALLLNGAVRRFVEQYFKSHFRVRLVNAYRNYHVPTDVLAKSEVFSDNWHCDHNRCDQLTLFINLSDVSEQDGPVHVVPRPQTRTVARSGEASRARIELERGQPTYVAKGVGPRGSSFFATTAQCLHRAGVPEPGHYRDIVVMQFFASRKPLGENWTNDVGDAGFYMKKIPRWNRATIAESSERRAA